MYTVDCTVVTVLADVVFNSTSTSNLYSNRGFTVLYIAVLLSNPPYTSHYGTVQYSTYCSLCVFVLLQYWIVCTAMQVP